MKKLFITWMTFAAACITHAAATQPNVVFILIDDLSHYGITAYGANKTSSVQGFFKDVEFETPRIDSLAKDGLRCDYAYAYPLCEPSRIALMSGMNNVRNYHQPKAQHASDITFGDLFQREGYETCIVGKWKQSRGTQEVDGKDYVFEFGWDEFCCFDVVTEGYRMIDPDIVENGKFMKYKGIDPITKRRYYGPDIFNRYALDFIDRNNDKPFFLYYSMVLMHDEHTPTPDTQPPEVFDSHDITQRTKYGHMLGDDRRYFPDMLAYMDKMVGRVLDKLEEQGLADNTLVVVMGDNGTKEAFSHTLPDGSIFLGDKGSSKEGGLHVPLLMRSPGKIPAGQSYDGLVNLTDILPTLCEAAQIEHPHKEALDGISFWPQARGKSKELHRETIYTWYLGNQHSTNTEHLLEYAFTKNFKRYAPTTIHPKGRFFDLRSDLFEQEGTKRKWPLLWNKWHHDGLNLEQLTPDQQQAYDQLGRVIAAKQYKPVDRLQVIKNEIPLVAGQRQNLKTNVFPIDATRRGLIWESNNPDVASIDKFGTVTAHQPGTVTITAYSWDDARPLASNAEETYSRKGIQDSVTLLVSP